MDFARANKLKARACMRTRAFGGGAKAVISLVLLRGDRNRDCLGCRSCGWLNRCSGREEEPEDGLPDWFVTNHPYPSVHHDWLAGGVDQLRASR